MEKTLAERCAELVRRWTGFDPDEPWAPVDPAEQCAKELAALPEVMAALAEAEYIDSMPGAYAAEKRRERKEARE